MSTGRYIAGGAVAVGALFYLWPKAAPAVPGAPSEAFKTPGVQNIEKAYQRGGATSTHTKAYGGTTMGQTDDAIREGGSTGNPQAFEKDNVGDEQRPGPTGPAAEKWKETMYGDKKGK
jgi:hypothetical protein